MKANLEIFLPGAFQIGDYSESRAGLGGFMVCKDEDPIAAMWLGMTNSNCALPTAAISDPSYRDEDRRVSFTIINKFCYKLC